MIDSLGDYYGKQLGPSAGTKIKDVASPESLLPSFQFFASIDSDYVTGQVLAADGGTTL
jgi:NAD(P)-dependent dehydrogenase (short-subunit alcohol dehydrogenase family)